MHNQKVLEELAALRQQLNELDADILKNLSTRKELIDKLSALKESLDQPVEQRDVFESQLLKRKLEAKALHLPENWAAEVFELLHKLSVNLQHERSKQKPKED